MFSELALLHAGGAWDNAKKYVEKGKVSIDGVPQKKGSELHKARGGFDLS